MEPKPFARSLFILGLFCLTGGCTHLFARPGMPVTDKIVVGAPRSVVESELGSPVAEVANINGATGFRECVYKVLVKNSLPDDATVGARLHAGMVGFTTYQYRVLYDREGNVVRADELRL